MQLHGNARYHILNGQMPTMGGWFDLGYVSPRDGNRKRANASLFLERAGIIVRGRVLGVTGSTDGCEAG